MFTITEIALKITNAVPSTLFISELPDTAYSKLVKAPPGTCSRVAEIGNWLREPAKISNS